jgi:foldase protein PrsA
MAAKKTVKASKTSTEKTPARKTSKNQAPKKVAASAPAKTNDVQVHSGSSDTRSPKVKKSYLIGFLAVVLLAILLYAFRSVFVAAMVNGQPVTRLSLVQELEKQNGKQALNSLVTKTLIFQEARKQNVNVSDQEVDAELKKIEQNLSAQGQKLDQVLELQGMTKEGLIEQIRIQKLIEKMVGKDIKVSDKEVQDYIADNRESFPEDANQQQINSQVREQLQQQQLNEKVQTWLDKLQKDANINYFVNF